MNWVLTSRSCESPDCSGERGKTILVFGKCLTAYTTDGDLWQREVLTELTRPASAERNRPSGISVLAWSQVVGGLAILLFFALGETQLHNYIDSLPANNWALMGWALLDTPFYVGLWVTIGLGALLTGIWILTGGKSVWGIEIVGCFSLALVGILYSGIGVDTLQSITPMPFLHLVALAVSFGFIPLAGGILGLLYLMRGNVREFFQA